MKRSLLLLCFIFCPLLLLSQGTGMEGRDSLLLEKIRQARYVAASPEVGSLGILHYSDLHGDDIAVARLHRFLDHFSPYVDALINTGDAVHYFAEATPEYPHDAAWWRNTGLAERTLFVLGNHDGAIRSDAKGHRESSADWDYMGKEWDFDTYFSGYVGSVGYSMPEGYDDPASPYYKSCFWVKDFADARIRIIGLDGIHFNETFRYVTDEQEVWLEKRLQETLDPDSGVSGYSVIIACHYPLDDFKGDNIRWDEDTHSFICNSNPDGGRVIDHRTRTVTNFNTYSISAYTANKRFSLRQKRSSPAEKYGYVSSEVNPFGDIVEHWVRQGGKFVVWLCGHCHADLLFYPAKYPDLLCLAVDQAGNLRGNGIADRPADMDARFCANYYGVDTRNGLFKIVRVGLSRDRFMIKKDVLCYDYIHKQVIFE